MLNKFHVLPYINPLIYDDINRLGDYNGLNTEITREIPIIVSLTSYRERFSKLQITLYSLINQSIKPDKIILWLDEDSEDLANLPHEVTRFVKNGLEIRFIKDIKSYTKAIYAFKEFPDSIIVTADDDIYYRKDWLKRLYLSYIVSPEDIHVHRAHRIKLSDGKILPYEKWPKHIKEESARFDNFLTGVGGVLYPPRCFKKEVFREDVFLKYAPTADDVWFWVMALTYDRKIRVVKNHYDSILLTDLVGHFSNKNLYSVNKNGGNDEQLVNLMKLYGSNVENKLSKINH